MEKKTVSLVLTSGGARGLAQIGAIDALLEEGFEVRAVSGSSVGSLVGGLYTVHKLHHYKEWIQDLSKMDVFKLFDFTFSGKGFVKGERVFEVMDTIFGDSLIEDGHIPYTAVATDILTKEEVWIQKGSLFQAIRASCAIPSVVTPFNYLGRVLIDGGVINPAPFEPIAHEKNDLAIVVNVNANLPYVSPFPTVQEQKKEQNEYLRQLAAFRASWSKYFPKSPVKSNAMDKLGYMSLMNKSVELMTDRLIELSIRHHQPDIVIDISRDSSGMFEFFKAKELIAAGREAALLGVDAYRKKVKDEDDQENHLREIRSIIS